MKKDILEQLRQPFDPALIRSRRGPGGKQFSYVAVGEYVKRLNEAFDGAWTFEIVRVDRFDEQLVVHGRLIAEDYVKEGVGGAVIRRTDEHGSPAALADDIKAAASDALKRCARLFGVGLELYSDEVEHERSIAHRRPIAHEDRRHGAGDPFRTRRSPGPGRVTAKQIEMMKRLVGQLGGDWDSYRDWVRANRGSNVEYCSKAEASELIEDLLERTRHPRGNGHAREQA